MLIEFSIENFRSIKEKQTHSFEPTVKKEIHTHNVKSPAEKIDLLDAQIPAQ